MNERVSTAIEKPDRPTRYPGERSRWLVPSDSNPEYPVLVDMDDEEVGEWCGCDDWHFRQKEKGPHYHCKHIQAVEREMRRLAIGDDLTATQARILEMLWQGCSQKCREQCDKEYPESRALVEKVLGRKLNIA